MHNSFFFDINELQFGKLNSLNNEKDIPNFHFCLPFGFCEVWLPDIVEKIYEKSPQASINAIPCDYRDILQLVDSGEMPYGLTCKIFINGAEVTENMLGHINFTPLFEARACALVPDNYPIKSNKTVSLKSMFDYSILSYEPSNYIFENIYYYYDDTNPQIINLPSVSAKNRLLAKGAGIAFGLYDVFSDQMLQEYPSNILVKTIREKIDIIFGYIINKNNTLSNNTINQLRFFDDFIIKKLIIPKNP